MEIKMAPAKITKAIGWDNNPVAPPFKLPVVLPNKSPTKPATALAAVVTTDPWEPGILKIVDNRILNKLLVLMVLMAAEPVSEKIPPMANNLIPKKVTK